MHVYYKHDNWDKEEVECNYTLCKSLNKVVGAELSVPKSHWKEDCSYKQTYEIHDHLAAAAAAVQIDGDGYLYLTQKEKSLLLHSVDENLGWKKQ